MALTDGERKSAQRKLLAEHVFNTLADRMWLYAAGLLLIEVVVKQDENYAPITISSAYGLVLSLVKVFLVGPVGSLIDRLPRWIGTSVALVIQNLSVAVNGFLMVCMLNGSLVLTTGGSFGLVTALSCVSILASVALMNAISRDWILEIASSEELTALNSWMRGIDQAMNIIASGLAGLCISYNKEFGAILIASINVGAMLIQGGLLYSVYKMAPSLSNPRQPISTEGNKVVRFVEQTYESLKIFLTSKVVVPGIVLSVLYINILGMSYPMYGFGRQSCLTEATLALVNICCAFIGFLAPALFPCFVKQMGLINTGVVAGVWMIVTMSVSCIGLFTPGSDYFLYTGNTQCPIETSHNATVKNNMWLKCPTDCGGKPIYDMPSEFISIGLIFGSAVLQRLGVFLFDMVTTQLFQLYVDPDKRNRAAAGQFSMNSVFNIIMYCFGLVWTETCDFGSGILSSAAIITTAYIGYFIWAARNKDFEQSDKTIESAEGKSTETNEEKTVL